MYLSKLFRAHLLLVILSAFFSVSCSEGISESQISEDDSKKSENDQNSGSNIKEPSGQDQGDKECDPNQQSTCGPGKSCWPSAVGGTCRDADGKVEPWGNCNFKTGPNGTTIIGSDCSEAAFCARSSASPTGGVCIKLCDQSSFDNCGESDTCLPGALYFEGVTDFGVCSGDPKCDLTAQNCGKNEGYDDATCFPYLVEKPDGTAAGLGQCVKLTSTVKAAEGEKCDTGESSPFAATSPCQAGLVCIANRCTKFCDSQADDPCGDNIACIDFSSTDGQSWGYCSGRKKCSSIKQDCEEKDATCFPFDDNFGLCTVLTNEPEKRAKLGESCTVKEDDLLSNSPCEAGLACVLGLCTEFCDAKASQNSCGEKRPNCNSIKDEKGRNKEKIGYCSVSCKVSEQGCFGKSTCKSTSLGDLCLPAGDKAEGAECSTDNDCGPAMSCLASKCSYYCSDKIKPSFDQASASIIKLQAGDKDCKDGGLRIIEGFDYDKDGKLDTSSNSLEKTVERALCNSLNNKGKLILVVASPLKAGEAGCDKGGLKIKAGFDKNADQALEESEREASIEPAAVCNISLATEYISSLSDYNGTECEYGGKKLEIGLDNNPADGSLGTAEVEASLTKIFCNGKPELKEAFSSVNDASAEQCANGGISILSGLDNNQNQILDSLEAKEKVVCDLEKGGKCDKNDDKGCVKLLNRGDFIYDWGVCTDACEVGKQTGCGEKETCSPGGFKDQGYCVSAGDNATVKPGDECSAVNRCQPGSICVAVSQTKTVCLALCDVASNDSCEQGRLGVCSPQFKNAANQLEWGFCIPQGLGE